jgi:hypothetical protein
LTTQLCCGTVVQVTEALYEDAGLRLDADGITIRRYYFPCACPKRIGYPGVRKIHRGIKRTLLVLDVGRRVRPCITPDDPDRVVELLRDRVPVS